MNTTRFPQLQAGDKCGNCGRKVKRLVRLDPMQIWCARCEFTYTAAGDSMGFRSSSMTQKEFAYREATRAR